MQSFQYRAKVMRSKFAEFRPLIVLAKLLFPTEGNFLSCLRSSEKVLYNNVPQGRPNSKDTFLVITLVREEN